MRTYKSTLLILAICGIVFLISGCGASPTANLGTSVIVPNTGSISGHVFSLNTTNQTFSGLSGYVVTVSTEAMTAEASFLTGSDGAYQLDRLPSGAVTITVTYESGGLFRSLSYTADSNSFDFVVDYSSDPGPSTVIGTIEGWSYDPLNDSFDVSCVAGSGRDYDSTLVRFDDANNTFEVAGAPSEGTTYVVADWWDDSFPPFGLDVYAYNKINTLGGSVHDCEITFEFSATIEGNVVNMPTGYTFTNAIASISNDHKNIVDAMGSISFPTVSSFRLSELIPAKSGDSYQVQILADTPDLDYYQKFFYNRSSVTGQTFNVNLPSLPTPIIKYINNGDFITGTPTVEWNSVPGASYYMIQIHDSDNGSDWVCYTNETRATLPSCVKDRFISGDDFYILLIAYKAINMNAPPYKPREAGFDMYPDFMAACYRSLTLN